MLSGVRYVLLIGILPLLLNGADITDQKLRTAQSDAATWLTYGKNYAGWRYADLAEINRTNVANLKLAWQYQTGDVKRPDDIGETTYQVTPLKIADTLYLCTPHNLAIALDAATGKEKWRYDPNSGMNPDRQHQTCRGVTYYKDVAAPPGSACAEASTP